MKKTILILFLLLSVIGVASFFLLFDREPTKSVVSKDIYYCPMHKQYVSDKPGNCPICSMKLVKKEGSDEEAMKKMLEQNTQQQSLPPEGSSIFISPERRQTLGVRSVPAEYETMKREVRTVGKIAYDETRITHIHTKLSGWIERVYVNFVGEAVKRGQPLFTIYSPELVSTQ